MGVSSAEERVMSENIFFPSLVYSRFPIMERWRLIADITVAIVIVMLLEFTVMLPAAFVVR
jgi:hypothetical protein